MFYRNLNELNIRLLFILVSLLYLSLAFLTNTFLFTKQFYFEVFANKFTGERITEMIEYSNKLIWVGYFCIPLFLILKLLIIALILCTGLEFGGYRIKYSLVLKIVILAESMMILMAFSKFTYLIYFKSTDIEILKNYYPFSLISLFQIKSIPYYFVYPLQLLNLFEVGYWIILVFLIKKTICVTFLNSFKVIASSYGISMFVWILFVMFIQLQFS
jgi:hypothetical protein